MTEYSMDTSNGSEEEQAATQTVLGALRTMMLHEPCLLETLELPTLDGVERLKTLIALLGKYQHSNVTLSNYLREHKVKEAFLVLLKARKEADANTLQALGLDRLLQVQVPHLEMNAQLV